MTNAPKLFRPKPFYRDLDAYALAERFRGWCRDQALENDGQDFVGLLGQYIEDEEPEADALFPLIVRMLAADLITLAPS